MLSNFREVKLSANKKRASYPGAVSDFLYSGTQEKVRSQFMTVTNPPAWQPHYDLIARFHANIGNDAAIEMDYLYLHQGNQMAARGMVFASGDVTADVREKRVQFRLGLQNNTRGPIAFRDILRVDAFDVFSGAPVKDACLQTIAESVNVFLDLHRLLLNRSYQTLRQETAGTTSPVAP
ncbi:MAG: hypothetical protein V4621_03445 [Pseudomonadota bacterium]